MKKIQETSKEKDGVEKIYNRIFMFYAVKKLHINFISIKLKLLLSEKKKTAWWKLFVNVTCLDLK